ncbi:MAG: DUF1080 domain-containing protein [Phycisphaerales bacterium]|jgi:hypothetical protein|nr:DUF1080 domain-containing protein [Phycisphaerales bacterium]
MTPYILAALFAMCSPPGWVDLFNGRDLTGWTIVNGAPSTWTVRDDMIVCSGVPTGVLRTNRMYENFVLELEWKHVVEGGNAGLFIWSDPVTAKGVPFTRSIEVQVMDKWETPNYTSDGDIFSIHGATMTPDRPHPGGWARSLPSKKRSKPSPEWNHYVLTCVDGSIKLAVNGEFVSGGHSMSPRKGYICLEAEGSEAHFRNLRIMELPPSATPLPPQDIAEVDAGFVSIYNGVDLTGWVTGEETADHWVVADWRLEHDGRGGDLWTQASFGDFEMIVDWRWTGESVSTARPVIELDGTPKVGESGEPVMVEVPDAGDSGIYLRGSSKSQVNAWCWPIGSGEVYGYRTDASMAPSVVAGVTPSSRADAPIGSWNRFLIRMVGDELCVDLNGVRVIDRAVLPGVAEVGPIGLQSHGSPIEFANIYVRPIDR